MKVGILRLFLTIHVSCCSKIGNPTRISRAGIAANGSALRRSVAADARTLSVRALNSAAALLIERPDIVGERQDVGRQELRAAHRRHAAPIVLRIRHAIADDLEIEAMLPSPQSHLPSVRLGPSGVPLALAPWQPAQVPPCAPWKIRSPSATCASVWPEGTGRLPVTSASGIGMNAFRRFGAAGFRPRLRPLQRAGAGAASIPVVLGSPWKVTRQIRPCWSSEMIERTVRSGRHSGWPVGGLARILVASGKAVGKDHVFPEALPSASGWNTTL